MGVGGRGRECIGKDGRGGGTKLACGPWLCPERATLQNKENIKINVFEVYCRQQDQTFSQRADRVLSAVPVTAME